MLGLELLLVGMIAFGYVYWVAPRDQRKVPLPLSIAVSSLLVGSLLAGSGVGSLRSAGLINPIPLTRESVAQGQAVYETHCVHCHGTTGRGDGPASAGLQPRTTDFRTHLAAGHTDAQLFDWIAKGVAGTAMPGYATVLTDDEPWHLLSYIRLHFGAGN